MKYSLSSLSQRSGQSLVLSFSLSVLMLHTPSMANDVGGTSEKELGSANLYDANVDMSVPIESQAELGQALGSSMNEKNIGTKAEAVETVGFSAEQIDQMVEQRIEAFRMSDQQLAALPENRRQQYQELMDSIYSAKRYEVILELQNKDLQKTVRGMEQKNKALAEQLESEGENGAQ